MNKLKLIIKNEYITDVNSRSFWIGTIIVPVLFGGFSLFIGFLIGDSETGRMMANPAAPDPDDMSGMQVMGMLSGILLALFLMIYGAQIYNKVKKEKINRVIEILATSVTGRTMMLAKIISVALVGLTQLLVWILMIGGILAGVIMLLNVDIPFQELLDSRVVIGLVWSFLFFIGGYVFYGSLYAACGAMTDKDNENQGYMTAITFLLLGSFYIGEYAVSNSSTAFVTFCSYFPFTSPTIGAVNAVAGSVPLWQSVLSLVSVYVFAALAVAISGKIYTSSLLLKGKKFTPKDIILFLKSK